MSISRRRLPRQRLPAKTMKRHDARRTYTMPPRERHDAGMLGELYGRLHLRLHSTRANSRQMGVRALPAYAVPASRFVILTYFFLAAMPHAAVATHAVASAAAYDYMLSVVDDEFRSDAEDIARHDSLDALYTASIFYFSLLTLLPRVIHLLQVSRRASRTHDVELSKRRATSRVKHARVIE